MKELFRIELIVYFFGTILGILITLCLMGLIISLVGMLSQTFRALKREFKK